MSVFTGSLLRVVLAAISACVAFALLGYLLRDTLRNMWLQRKQQQLRQRQRQQFWGYE